MYNIYDFNAGCESLGAAAIHFGEQLAKIVKTMLNDLMPTLKSLKRLGRNMTEKWALDRITHSIEYKTAATQYPKLAHLARHAKKKRVRKKNVKRLYQIGDDILCGRRKL